MSIRTRLTLSIVAAMALSLGALGGTVYLRARADLLRTLDRDLRQRAEGMRDFRRFGPPGERRGPPFGERGGGKAFGPRFEGRGKGRFPGPPGGRPRGPGWRFAPLIVRPDGTIIGPADHSEAWDRAAAQRAFEGPALYTTTLVNDDPTRVFSLPLREDGRVEYVIQVAHPLTDTYQALAGLTRTLFTLIPVALLVAAGGGAALIGRVLRPVRAITNTARDLGVEDLSKRLPVTGRDEFSELAATFNAMLARLEQAFRRMGEVLEQQRRFTGDASHELRTPLGIVKANASLALSAERSPAEYREALGAIDLAANRMNTIVQDLLMLARSDGGQLGQHPTITPLREILARAVTVVTPDQAALRVEIPEGLHVVGNVEELARVFSNLLENAARHTSPEGSITVAAWVEDGHTRITIADTGEGIPPEHLPHVCERFYRIDSARARNGRGGTGLGLAICQSIVHAHGGTLEVTSAPGQGTTVQVSLPSAVPSDSPASVRPEGP